MSDPAGRGAGTVVVGTGGLGTGVIFALARNETLGREESRAARLLPAEDFCKLHIVFHYLRRLLPRDVLVVPVGCIGADASGSHVLELMADVGLDTSRLEALPDRPTLFSASFVYPDGDGGNISDSESASSAVTPDQVVRAVREEHARNPDAQGFALALPEVPVATRVALLRAAREVGWGTVASFVAGEAEAVVAHGLLPESDLVVVNREEAAAVTGLPPWHDPASARATVEGLRTLAGTATLAVTGGSDGAWTWDGEALLHNPSMPAHVVSTAGAGDAFAAGLLVGTVAGASLADATALASLVASLAVESAGTINFGVGPEQVLSAATRSGTRLQPAIADLLRAAQ